MFGDASDQCGHDTRLGSRCTRKGLYWMVRVGTEDPPVLVCGNHANPMSLRGWRLVGGGER